MSILRYRNLRVLCLLLTLCGGELLSQSPTPELSPNREDVLKVETSLVIVPATVFDREGRYMAGLQKLNFKLFEGGEEQNIEYFSTTSDQLTVLLLIDTSSSMTPYLPKLADSVGVFIRQLRPENQMIIASFADSVRQSQARTRVSDVKRDLTIRAGGSPTRVFDAVQWAIRKLEPISGRKAIVLFTDGFSTTGHATAESNLRDAQESTSLIYTIKFGSAVQTRAPIRNEIPPNLKLDKDSLHGGNPNKSDSTFSNPTLIYPGLNKRQAEIVDRQVDQYLGELAGLSGGRTYKIDQIGDLKSTFEQIVVELSSQYVLGYYPKTARTDASPQPIKVEVDAADARVRARRSVVYKLTK